MSRRLDSVPAQSRNQCSRVCGPSPHLGHVGSTVALSRCWYALKLLLQSRNVEHIMVQTMHLIHKPSPWRLDLIFTARAHAVYCRPAATQHSLPSIRSTLAASQPWWSQLLGQTQPAVSHCSKSVSAGLWNFHFLPNDDPYWHKTQHMSCAHTVRVCMQNFAAIRRADSEEIADRR